MNRYKKISAVILTVILMSTGLCSCYDDMEMNELAYVIALGIDVSGDGMYNYTFQISNPIASGGGGEEKPEKEMSTEEGSENENEDWDKSKIEENKNSGVMDIVVKAHNYAEAAELANNIISKHINLAHLKVIAFSEEASREGLDRHTEFLMSEREIRPGTNVIVAKKSAEYFLKNVNPKLDMSTAKYYELLINNENMNYSRAVELRELYDKGFGADKVDGILPLGDVSENTKSVEFSLQNSAAAEADGTEGGTIAGNVDRLSGEKTELFGAAVIDDMKMVGEMDGDAVKYYKLILGELKDGGVFPNEDKSIIIKNCRKSRISVDTSDDTPKISMEIYAEVESADDISGLKKKIEDNIYMLLIKTSREYQSDIFGISSYARKNFLTWQEFETYDWNSKYKNSVFSVNVELKNSEFNEARFIIN